MQIAQRLKNKKEFATLQEIIKVKEVKMLKDYFLNIKQELEEELELIERNYHNGKYKTPQEKDICTLIYNIEKHRTIVAISIIKNNFELITDLD